jgi:long-chain acyl-CoA synthetase
MDQGAGPGVHDADATTSEEGSSPQPSMAALLLQHPLPDDDTLVYSGRQAYSVAEMREASRRLSHQITEAGVGPGRVVAAIGSAGPRPLVAMYATWLAGAVYMPCNDRSTDAEIVQTLEESPPALLIGPAGRLDSVGRTCGSIADGGGLNWTAQAAATESGPTYDPDVALVMRTSGTTGRAKAVLLRHSGTIAALDAVLARLRASSSGRTPKRDTGAVPNLIPVSLALWAGIYNTLFAFRVGAPVILLERFSTGEFVRVVKEFKLGSTVLAPAMISMLNDDPGITDLEPLRFVRSITAPLRKEEAERFYDRFGIVVLNSYGQTELGGEVVGWTAADARAFGTTKLGSVGRPHGGIDIKILDENGSALGTDQPGEIWVRSPFLMRGYANASESLADRIHNGYLRTGDLGEVDADGFLWIQGRESDVINRGGLKVSPEEVEDVLRAHPDVADVCVAGVPDPRLGEVPYAWIVRRRNFDPDSLAAWCRSRLAAYKVPVGFESINEIPRSEIGKVLRGRLGPP